MALQFHRAPLHDAAVGRLEDANDFEAECRVAPMSGASASDHPNQVPGGLGHASTRGIAGSGSVSVPRHRRTDTRCPYPMGEP